MIKRWIKTAPALLLAVLLCVCAPALETGEACALLQTGARRVCRISAFALTFQRRDRPVQTHRRAVPFVRARGARRRACGDLPSLAQRQAGAVRSDGGRARLLTAGDAGRDAAEGYIEWYFSHLNTADEDAYGIDGTVYDTYFFIEDGDSPRLLEITGRALFAAEYGDGASNPHAYASSDASSAAFLSLLRAYVERYGGLGRFSDRLTED